ncbi:putative serine/threonine-protein kinase [Nymphaea thermarum]|nr:putative serine/threonine-protein kinase [Nymphaea thermarum]
MYTLVNLFSVFENCVMAEASRFILELTELSLQDPGNWNLLSLHEGLSCKNYIDVYSFGIVTWELITGEEPYAHMHCASIIGKSYMIDSVSSPGGIVNNSLRRQVPAWCDPEWRSLMLRCWSSEPSERPSFAEICQALRKMFAVLSGK